MKHLIAALLLFACVPAFAGTVTINWEHPTSCSDGSDVATNCPTSGYEISRGASPTGTAYSVVETVAATVTSVTYTNVPAGTRCYYLKTVSGQLKSGESNRVCVDVPFVSPRAPQGVSVRVEVTVTTP